MSSDLSHKRSATVFDRLAGFLGRVEAIDVGDEVVQARRCGADGF